MKIKQNINKHNIYIKEWKINKNKIGYTNKTKLYIKINWKENKSKNGNKNRN